jgi:hypothetical protein
MEAVGLAATQQFSLAQARAELEGGGMTAFVAWCSTVSRRLHAAFAGLTLAWAVAALLVHDFGMPLPGHHLGAAMQDIVLALAGCFLVGGWLSAICFREILLQYLLRRHAAIVLVATLQLMAAAAASLLLYPFIGWYAIGVAELARGVAFVAAVRWTSGPLDVQLRASH